MLRTVAETLHRTKSPIMKQNLMIAHFGARTFTARLVTSIESLLRKTLKVYIQNFKKFKIRKFQEIVNVFALDTNEIAKVDKPIRLDK